MKLKDKLFTVINDQPYLNPVGINIPEFKRLWEGDKTEEKVDYAKELAYIYHMWEYASPYFDRKNKEDEIIKDFIGKSRWKPTKRVLAALAKYKSLDGTAEKRALNAAVATCDALADDLGQLRQDTDQLEKILTEIDTEIKMADSIHQKVELMKMKLDLQEQKMKIAKMIMDTMPKLEKTIETTLLLRKKVTTSVFKGENADSIIGEFFMDSLMNEIAYEKQNEKQD